MESIVRVNNWAKKLSRTKFGKIAIRSILAVSLMAVGGYLHYLSTFGSQDNLWDRVGVFLSAMFAFLVTTVIIIERIFRIESEEKKIQLAESQLRNEGIEGEEFGLKLSNQIMNVINREVESKDRTYEERQKHYGLEKEHLAEKFLEMLGERVNYLKSQGVENIQIIFDSGTTIAPMFKTMAFKASEDKDYWARKVEIVTNNLKGVQITLGYRENEDTISLQNPDNDRYREIPIKCTILPGKILSAYEGVGDSFTLRSIRSLYARNKRKGYHTISVTTGNYILYDIVSNNFLPVARTGFHPHVKSALYSTSDEVYLIAPLGKILANKSESDLSGILKGLNRDLEFSENPPLKCDESYKLVNDPSLEIDLEKKDKNKFPVQDLDEWMNKSILVTTRRGQMDILYPHYHTLDSTLKSFDPKSGVKVTKSIWMTDFDEVPARKADQFKIAIPHSKLRPYADKYLEIPSAKIDVLKAG